MSDIDKLYEQFQLDNKQDGFVPTSKYIFGDAYLKGKEARQPELENKITKLEWVLAQVEQQATIWKSEAKTQQSTVHEIYQLVTGAKGEPGDWNGANPVRVLITRQCELEGIIGELAEAWAKIAKHKGSGAPSGLYTEFDVTLTRAQKMLEG